MWNCRRENRSFNDFLAPLSVQTAAVVRRSRRGDKWQQLTNGMNELLLFGLAVGSSDLNISNNYRCHYDGMFSGDFVDFWGYNDWHTHAYTVAFAPGLGASSRAARTPWRSSTIRRTQWAMRSISARRWAMRTRRRACGALHLGRATTTLRIRDAI